MKRKEKNIQKCFWDHSKWGEKGVWILDVHHLRDCLGEIGFFFSLLFTTNKNNRNKYYKKGLFSSRPYRPRNFLWWSWFYYLILKRACECNPITTYLYLTRFIIVYSKFEAEKLNDREKWTNTNKHQHPHRLTIKWLKQITASRDLNFYIIRNSCIDHFYGGDDGTWCKELVLNCYLTP